jgi:hypothetical protein
MDQQCQLSSNSLDVPTILVHNAIEEQKLMKNAIVPKSKNIKRLHVWFVGILLFLPSLNLQRLWAETTFTNQDNLGFGLMIPKTNLIAGDKVIASMIVSNGLDVERSVGWGTGNPCSIGFGEFLIMEKSNGRKIDCAIPFEDRVGFVSESLGIMGGHQSRAFEFNLADGYALTNAGVYTVQAVGKFQYHETPNNRFTLLAPPITVWLSPKAETNSMSDSKPANQ